MEQFALPLQPVRELFSVTELNERIREVLAGEIGLVHVSGEISGTRLAPSGHYYFTLKDSEAQLKCACFRMTARYLKFKPKDGVSVVARGRLDVYPARGEYQLLVEALEPQGYGALQFAFEELKKKLALEGLFDPTRKRPLPKLPRRIGIVTSPAGAVIQDMLNILARRFRGLHIRIYPALVQGEGSAEQICAGLQYFSRSGWPDAVILARGGGSLEDLWVFNTEEVARTIAASAVPIISAIGHETDFTIADFVADLRAPTPSAAAELVICTEEQLRERIEQCCRTMEQRMRYRLSLASRALHERGTDRAARVLHRFIGQRLQRIDEWQRSLLEAVRRRIRINRSRWEQVSERLRRTDIRLRLRDARPKVQQLENRGVEAIRAKLRRQQQRLVLANARLQQLNPLQVLQRGYAIVQTPAGAVIKSEGEATPGLLLNVRVADGSFVVRTEPQKSAEPE